MARRRVVLVLGVFVALVAMLLPVLVVNETAALMDPSDGTLDDVPGATPAGIGDADFADLQYGDPTEHLSLVEPPEADHTGAVQLAIPLLIPAGRADVQPDLSLQYDSSGGSSWMGVGWDLSVGAVSVDTSWGAPRFDPARETETYELDGDRLHPNAIRDESALELRLPGPRADYVRQVETEFERIIRHGDATTGYWWQVTDKDGTDRWYGGSPEGQDRGAILGATAPKDGTSPGDFHWALSYVEDISGNVMRLSYDKRSNVAIGLSSGSTPGVALYLDTITYTGFAEDEGADEAAGDPVDRPPYRIEFHRDDDLGIPAGQRRRDVTVDARGGAPVVSRDLLREVRISYLPPNAAATATGSLVGGYRFEYDIDAPFDKTRLTRVGQFGTDDQVHAWHDLAWFDDVEEEGRGTRHEGDRYVGFASGVLWSGDGEDNDTSNVEGTSAIASSGRGGGDGGAYIGFNPVAPSKILSFGGSFSIAGGESRDLSTLLDLDGDGLPDKVFMEGSKVLWSRNVTRPDTEHVAGGHFATAEELRTMDQIGVSRDLSVTLLAEVYPVASVQIGGGFGFGFIEQYFNDVNGDGRPDFIKPDGGKQVVYFNVRTADGKITFVKDSALTEVPLSPFDSDLAYMPVEGTQDLLADTSPRIDTVRRWVAPFTGTVQVTGTPTLAQGAAYIGDGARVMLEAHGSSSAMAGGARKFDALLDAETPSESHDVSVPVEKGDHLFFRVHVIENSQNDIVEWSPVVSYTATGSDAPEEYASDANGRSQVVYDLAEDFTVFGRSGGRTALPDAGPASLQVTVHRTGALTDDVEVIVRHRRNDGTGGTEAVELLEPVEDVAPALEAGAADAEPASQVLTYEFDVNPMGVGTDDDTGDTYDDPDWLELEVITDSPVDPNAFGLEVDLETTPPSTGPGPTVPADVDLAALAEEGREGSAEPSMFDGTFEPIVIPSVRVFADSDGSVPYTPYVPDDDGQQKLKLEVTGSLPSEPTATTAVVTVKRADDGTVTVVKKDTFDISSTKDGDDYQLEGRLDEFTFDGTDGDHHWIEVSVPDPAVGGALALTAEIEADGSWEAFDEIRLHHPGVQGVFPSANRGWAAAGYNADHPDAAGAEALNVAQFSFSPRGVPEDADEDTEVPSGDDLKADDLVGDVTGDLAEVGDLRDGFEGSYPYIPWAGSADAPADQWRSADKVTLFAERSAMRSARLGREVVQLDTGTGPSDDARPAPELLNIDGSFNVALGLGPASLSAAFGGGRDVRDLTDINGDGFADIRSGASVEFTGARGGKAMTASAFENTTSTAISVGGGLGGSPVGVNGKDKTGASHHNSSAGSPTSTNKTRGMSLGIGGDLQSSWDNYLVGDSVKSELDSNGGGRLPEQDEDAIRGVLVERAMDDINGDGLPDIIDSWSNGKMYVRIGLGHRFAEEIVWAEGIHTATKDIAASLNGGFQINAYEFGGGVGGSESASLTEMMWADVDGDGVPDRFRQPGTDRPAITFASGDGNLGREVAFGTFPRRSSGFPAVTDAERAGWSRSASVTGGVDFTIYIGPICVVACYIIVNPGIHGGYDRSWTEISMEDMNGDGNLDIVESAQHDDVLVHLNQAGRTNLLKSVRNPIGGTVRLDYTRQGNTVEQPESLWVMSTLEVDDGRPGDGPDVRRSEFTYEGNRYDRLHRTLLGYSKVTELEVDPADHTQTLRRHERTYRNVTPFDSGLLVRETTAAPDGTVLEESTTSWELATVDGGQPVDPSSLPAVDTAARVALFDLALAPRMVTDAFSSFDAEGDEQTQSMEFAWDERGNLVRMHQRNEGGTAGDDTVTLVSYPDCGDTTADREDMSWVQVPATVAVHAGSDSGELLRYRDGSLDLCDNAVPIRIVESQGQDACGDDVYAVTELWFDVYGSYNAVRSPANQLLGETDPAACPGQPTPAPTGPHTFYGCTDATSAPPEDATADDLAAIAAAIVDAEATDRYCVDYVYDPHRFTDLARITDSHGVESTATYDPLTGRMASETDANGHTTEYCYDTQGRIAAVAAPREAAAFSCGQAGPPPTVSYHYGLPTDAHAWAVARHHDAFRADGTPDNDTLDTAAFVDGIGRVVQRKRDGEVITVDGPVVVVEGAVEFDALGREAKEWYPVVEVADYAGSGLPNHLTTYNVLSSSDTTDANGDGIGDLTHVPITDPTVRTHDLRDRLTSLTLPDGNVEQYAYDIAQPPGRSFNVGSSTQTDPVGRAVRRYVDVRGAVLAIEELPAPTTVAVDDDTDPLATFPVAGGADQSRIADSEGTGAGAITTNFEYDALGRLVSVTDTAGAVTTHVYDMLDNRTATTTPDAGLTERRWTPSGQLAELVDGIRAAAGTAVVHDYDFDRLVGVDYPDDTPDVTYTYGDELTIGAPANSQGHVARVEDGSMIRSYAYDVDGNVASEAATRQLDPFGIGQDEPQPTYTTTWAYDSLQRLRTLVYPEGEILTHDYDRGGATSRLRSVAPQHDLYDVDGVAVPQPDMDITYVADVGYDEFGAVRRLETGTGIVSTYDHDPRRRTLVGINTDSTAIEQYDGSTSVARPLQRMRYSYDAVGNVLDAANTLYDPGSATSLASLDPVPENNVPGPAQHSYTYDGHYRLTGATARYVDRQENRDYTYEADYAPNGNLVHKSQVTTTTSTTKKGGGGKPKDGGNPKKGNGGGTTDGSTSTNQCDGNTSSGGGIANQDTETTYVLAREDFVYDDAAPHQLRQAGDRTYEFDANGSLVRWVQPCASGGGSELVRELTWDADNRLERIGQGSNDTEYRYTAEGLRALERGPGGTLFFVNEHWRVDNDGHRYANVFLGDTMIANHRTDPQPEAPPPCDPELEECGCDPQTQVCSCDDPALCGCDPTTTVHDPDAGTCQPKPELTIHFLHGDLQGSLRVATDEVGGVFQYLEYLPTGNPWVAGQSRILDTPYLFTGSWTDTTYDLVNFGERWYEPREEQFYSVEPLLDEDPLAVLGDPSLQSAYTYAASNPLRYVDPDGRAPENPVTIGSGSKTRTFDLGTDNSKHAKGSVRISDAARRGREGPARLGTLLISHDERGQATQQKFQDVADKIDKFFQPLRFQASGTPLKPSTWGVEYANYGRGADRKSTPDPTAAAGPNPGPGQTGNTSSSTSGPTTAGGGSAAPPPTTPAGGGPGPSTSANSASNASATSTSSSPPTQPLAGSAEAPGPATSR